MKKLALTSILLLYGVFLSAQSVTVDLSNVTAPVGSNTITVEATRSGTFSGSGGFTWSISPSTGVTITGAFASRNFEFDATAATGSYTITVSRSTTTVSTTVNLHDANFWAARSSSDFSSANNRVESFSISGGTYTAGPTLLFSTDAYFAALGRSPYPTVPSGYFYWIPNDGSNDGLLEIYGRNGDGSGSNVLVGSLDVNGSSNVDLGFVRLALDKNGVGWALAKNDDNTLLYLVRIPFNNLNSVTPVLEDGDVSLVGGVVSTFQNGDICLDDNGNIYALANSGGNTEIYMGVPSGSSTTLTKRWNILDGSSNAFVGSVNGVCFDDAGGMYLSTNGNSGGVTDGIYYLSPSTVQNTPSGSTINALLVYEGSNFTDLGTNVWPAETVLPVTYGVINARENAGQLHVNWQTLTEKDCKEYVVEVSKDGVSWKSIGKLVSKASNGRSSSPIAYEFVTSVSLAFAGLSLAFLLLSTFFKSRVLKALMLLAVVGFAVSCMKDNSSLAGANKEDSKYVRIVQHGTDGSVNYSKVVVIGKGD